MAVTFRGAYNSGGAANPTTGLSWLLTGCNPQVGDLAVCVAYSRASTKTFTNISAAITQRQYPAGNATYGHIYIGTATITQAMIDANTVGTGTLNSVTNGTTGWITAVFAGVYRDSVTPVTGAAGNPDPPQITGTTLGDCLVVIFGEMDQNDGVTAPTNFTLNANAQWSATTGTDGSSGLAYDLDGGTGGTVDPAVFTTTTDAAFYACTLSIAPPPPSVTSISPNEAAENVATAVTIAGEAFDGATGVTVGGHAASNVTVVNANSITCTLPAHAAEANLQVQVTTPAGVSSDVAGDNFTYYQDAITVQRADGAGAYDDHYTGSWATAPKEWADVATSLTSGVAYQYRAKRTIKGLDSAWSNEPSVTYFFGWEGYFTCEAISAVAVNVPLPDRVRVERKSTGSFVEVYVDDWPDLALTDLAAGLVSGTTYYYRVRRDENGVFSEYSNEPGVVYVWGSSFIPQMIVI